MSARTKVKQFLGINIYVDSKDGSFCATIEGAECRSNSLPNIQATIKRHRRGVKAIAAGVRTVHPVDPEVVTIAHVERDYADDFVYHTGRGRVWGDLYEYTEEGLASLKEVSKQYQAAKQALEDEWAQRWKDALSKLKPPDGEKIMAALSGADKEVE